MLISQCIKDVKLIVNMEGLDLENVMAVQFEINKT